MLNMAVLTVSDTRTLVSDQSGAYLVGALTQAGHNLSGRALLPDCQWRIRAQVAAWMAAIEVDVVLITGGTGLAPRDRTIEAVRPLLECTIDGFGELFRTLSFAEIGTATINSRALAGMGNKTLVFCLPGSSGACRTAWEGILREQLDPAHRPCNLAEILLRASPRSKKA
jgi:molybdenum cofactor biosynthesis protein B